MSVIQTIYSPSIIATVPASDSLTQSFTINEPGEYDLSCPGFDWYYGDAPGMDLADMTLVPAGSTATFTIAFGDSAITKWVRSAPRIPALINVTYTPGINGALPTGLTGYTGAQNTALGQNTGGILTDTEQNTWIGAHAGTAVIDGNDNTGVGAFALNKITHGDRNVAVGQFALGFVDTGNDNVGIGRAAASALTSGNSNVAVGTNAAVALTDGQHNIAIGVNAMGASAHSNSNVAVGETALGSIPSGDSNVAIGYGAIVGNAAGGGCYNNVAVGRGALAALQSSNNVAVGYLAGGEIVGGSNNILLGREAGSGLGDTNGMLAIGSPVAHIDVIRISSSAAEGAHVGDPLTFDKAAAFGAFIVNIVALVEADPIVTNAALGSEFSITLTGSHTMANPTNPTTGQRLTYRITQGGGGSNLITWDTAFTFGTDVVSPTLSTTVGLTDYVTFEYNGTSWNCLAWARGY